VQIPLEGIFPNDTLRLHALMLAPGDAEFRRALYACEYVRGFEWDTPGATVTVFTELIHDLLHAPAYKDLVAGVKERTKRATLAGYVLCSLFLMSRYPELMGARSSGGPSLNKAFHVCTHLASAESWTYGDGKPLPKSDTPVKAAWEEFKSVAHIWAAYSWNLAMPAAPQREILRPENIRAFLQTARYFEEFGKSLMLDKRSAGTKERLLRSDDLWQVPEDYKASILLPVDPAVLSGSPLSRALRAYAATKK
jgi:hypothetical protein